MGGKKRLRLPRNLEESRWKGETRTSEQGCWHVVLIGQREASEAVRDWKQLLQPVKGHFGGGGGQS